MLLQFRLCLETRSTFVARVLDIAMPGLELVHIKRARVGEFERAHRTRPLSGWRFLMIFQMPIVAVTLVNGCPYKVDKHTQSWKQRTSRTTRNGT